MFSRTIIADQWYLNNDLGNWRWSIEIVSMNGWGRIYYQKKKLSAGNDDGRLNKLLENASLHRRFFVTRTDRVGLGLWNLREVGDVCVLSGGDIPFIL